MKKKPKEEVLTVKEVVTESEKLPKETEIIDKETLPSLMKKAEKIANDPKLKLNETVFHKVDVKPNKSIEAMRKTLDEMKATTSRTSFVSVKDIPENETIPIRVDLGGNNRDVYITLDKLDMQMIFESVSQKLMDIANSKTKKDHSQKVVITLKGIGDLEFTNTGSSKISNASIGFTHDSYNAHCSENDCKSCPYNKICSPGR